MAAVLALTLSPKPSMMLRKGAVISGFFEAATRTSDELWARTDESNTSCFDLAGELVESWNVSFHVSRLDSPDQDELQRSQRGSRNCGAPCEHHCTL